MKKVLITLVLLMVTLSACSGKKEVEMGRYIDSASEVTLILQDGNGFMLVVPSEISFAPMGEFSVKDNKILLMANEDEHVFSVEDKMLVFESGDWLESRVEKGTKFYLSGE